MYSSSNSELIQLYVVVRVGAGGRLGFYVLLNQQTFSNGITKFFYSFEAFVKCIEIYLSNYKEQFTTSRIKNNNPILAVE